MNREVQGIISRWESCSCRYTYAASGKMDERLAQTGLTWALVTQQAGAVISLASKMGNCSAKFFTVVASQVYLQLLPVRSTAVWREDFLMWAVPKILLCFSALHPQKWEGIVTLCTNVGLCSSLRQQPSFELSSLYLAPFFCLNTHYLQKHKWRANFFTDLYTPRYHLVLNL